MRRNLLITLTVVAVLFASQLVTTAQDADACDPAALITQLTALSSSGDAAEDINALLEVRNQITAQHVACNGYSFEGSGGKAVGPIELPEGKYLLTFTTAEYIILEAELIDGECTVDDDPIDKYAILAETPGGAEEGAAAVIDSEGCRVLFLLSSIRESWTLTLEPLS